MKQAWFSGNNYKSSHKVKGHVNSKVSKNGWPTSFPEQDSTWFDAAGGLHTEAVDFSAFLIGLMKGKDISKSLLNEMFKQQVALDKKSPHYLMNGDTGWGLGIAIRPVSFATIYEHGGNNVDFQSGFKINRDNQNGYVFFTNCVHGVAFKNKIAELLIN